MNPEIIEQLESMSEEEMQALMETQFPEELEKQAAAEVVEAELAEALYAYGSLSAERALAEVETGGDLSKIASEEDIKAQEEAEAGVALLIEEAIQELGLAESEDEIELHKTAQACAAVIFEGYSDTLEKIAKAKASPGMMDSLRALSAGATKKISEGYKGTKKMIRKHKGKAGVAAGLGIGYGGSVAADKMMAKKASDMTLGEIVATVHGVNEIEIGMDKLAARGGAKAKGMMDGLKKSWQSASKADSERYGKAKEQVGNAYGATKKHVKAHRGLYGMAGGAAVGAGAHRASKQD